MHLDPQRAVTSRLFCNKMWNAVRFVLRHIENHGQPHCDALTTTTSGELDVAALPVAERWLLSRLGAAAEAFDHGCRTFHIGAAATAVCAALLPLPATAADTVLGIMFPQVHSFFLQELCDVYLEWSKSTLNSDAASAADVQVGAFAPYSFRVDALW